MRLILDNWKTTANGLVSAVIAVCLALMALQSPLITPKVGMWLVIVLAVARALVGVLQTDAGTVTAAVKQAQATQPKGN